MRQLADAAAISRFLEALGRAASAPATVYLVGGATAVRRGWRRSTLDIDLELVPDSGELLRAIAELKSRLGVNVELAAPHHFIPELPGWKERSPFVERHGLLSVHDYDYYAQTLAKIERGHAQDREDVRTMLATGLVEPAELRRLFAAIAPELYRYPAVDPPSFERALAAALDAS
jgi:hypothetical protein